MHDNGFDLVPDFSGDDFTDDKQIQKARQQARLEMQQFQEALTHLKKQLEIEDSSHRNFKNFLMFRNLQAVPTFTMASSATDPQLVVAVAEYTVHFSGGRHSSSTTDSYLFGRIRLDKEYPDTYITRESLKETIADIFTRNELNFPEQKKFCRKFYVLTKDKEKLFLRWQHKNLNDLAAFPEMELELLGNTCLFRNSRKPVTPEVAAQFGELCKVLMTLLK